MTIRDVATPDEPWRRDRAEHGGASDHPDDALAERTEDERVSAGLADYVPDEVPSATEADQGPELTDTEQYAEELAEVRREQDAGALGVEGDGEDFPPTHYERR